MKTLIPITVLLLSACAAPVSAEQIQASAVAHLTAVAPVATETPTDEEVYLLLLEDSFDRFVAALGDLTALNTAVTQDPNLLSDPTWRENADVALRVLSVNGALLSSLNRLAPERFYDFDQLLQFTYLEMILLDSSYRAALESGDPSDLDEAGERLASVQGFVSAAETLLASLTGQ